MISTRRPCSTNTRSGEDERARQAWIVERRQAEQRQFTFAPLSFDLPRYMSVAPFDTHHCPLLYYDIDKIKIEAQQ